MEQYYMSTEYDSTKYVVPKWANWEDEHMDTVG